LQENAIEAQRILGASYKALGMPAQALEQTEKYLQLYDSSMQKDKLDIITRLEVKYRLSEKNKELTLQKLTTTEAENSVRQKNLWLINITLLLVSLLLIFTFLHYHNLNKQRLQQEKINSIQQQMEIENLNATIRGEEKERSRIARELHDGIGGLLAGANMSLETFKTNEQHIREHADLNAGMQLLAEAAVELRKTAHNMMPEILLQIGLVEAIRHFCDNMNRTIPTNISFQALGEQRNFTGEFELAVYRIIQELLHNIVKHAHAKNAIVQISFHEKDFSITVEDDGVGMADHHSSLKKGMGLTSIRERLKSIHGSILVQSAPDEGTSVNIEFELRENNVLV
jgi:signal transduction histidine kinase